MEVQGDDFGDLQVEAGRSEDAAAALRHVLDLCQPGTLAVADQDVRGEGHALTPALIELFHDTPPLE
nr:hypothetical protein [Alkalisalibacterium limincola]